MKVASGNLYSMKEACEACGLPYETLKFYCNKGLVPNVKRDGANRRVFDERDIAWIKGLICLKRCGMSIAEMQRYLQLCLQGEQGIPERKEFLAEKRRFLLQKLDEVQASIDYIDWKQGFYDRVLAGEEEYRSNLRRVPPSFTSEEPNEESMDAIVEANGLLASGKAGHFSDGGSLIEAALAP